MKTLNTQIIKYGITIFVALTGYFLAMDALGLVHNLNLRIFNAIILFSGIFILLKRFKKQKYDKSFSYLNGLSAGFFVTLIATVGFALFMIAYLLINPDFLMAIRTNEPQGIYLNIPAIVTLIIIEGVASGILFSYMSMQFLKEGVAVESSVSEEAH
ncbi:MAG: DUF4199 domain-containing protein [Bacteroidota bacterium]